MKATMDIKNRFVIIRAGGRGERFWPVSREQRPRQLLKLPGKRSFLQQGFDRVRPLVPVTNISVIGNETQLPEVRRQLPKIPSPGIYFSRFSGTIVWPGIQRA
ncbi:MAG: sugar phosphate nucleotidyltransferase [Verrucomicrobiota bacterium]|jgi:mannose-1-phosphate guanylyltransferase